MDIKLPLNFFGEEIAPTVFISEKQSSDVSPRKLFGKYFSDTGIFNIYPDEMAYRGDFLGYVFTSEPEDKDCFYAVSTDDKLVFYLNGTPVKTEVYSLYQNIFSRNSGILENAIMSRKRAVILGCGSVGSLVALELARSGCGHFLLVDSDTLEYHNLCRHQCGIEDVGDLKVNALKRRILNINPYADVEVSGTVFQDINKQKLDDFCIPGDTVFVGCADNRTADVYANRISICYKCAYVSIGFWERAYAGEIFYHIPGRDMPCYECAIGDGGGKVEANHHVYSTQENLEGIKFEPGISVDINFITTIGIKLIIDILNITNDEFIPRLLNNLKQFTLICNTNDPEIGGDMVSIFSYPLQVSTSLVVCFRNKCDNCCKYEIETEENVCSSTEMTL